MSVVAMGVAAVITFLSSFPVYSDDFLCGT